MNDEDRVKEIYEVAQKLQSLVNEAEDNGISVSLKFLSYPTMQGKLYSMITVEATKKINIPYIVTYTGVP